MRVLGIAALVLLSSCAAPVANQRGLRSVPPEMGKIAWAISPAQVIEAKKLGLSVVWVGKVVEFTVTPRDGKVVLEWICDYLPFRSPGEEAIRTRPISVGQSGQGRFVVNLVEVKMTEAQAKTLQQQFAKSPQYLLVAGTVKAIEERSGAPVVFLWTQKFELSKELVSVAD